MSKSFTADNLIKSSRFVYLYNASDADFRQAVRQGVAEIIPQYPQLCHPTTHTLMANLFTSLAIHDYHLAHGLSEQQSLDIITRTMEAYMEPRRRAYHRLLRHRPIFRLACRFMPSLMSLTNGHGFQIDEVKVPGGMGFDCTLCPFATVTQARGHAALGPCFCHIDDYMYGSVPNVTFERGGTLCRGQERCDFRFHWEKGANE